MPFCLEGAKNGGHYPHLARLRRVFCISNLWKTRIALHQFLPKLRVQD